MQLQKFVGESMPVVLNSLKDALGSDAIILANRRVGDHIEIIATGTLDEASINNAELFCVDENVNSTADTLTKGETTGSSYADTAEYANNNIDYANQTKLERSQNESDCDASINIDVPTQVSVEHESTTATAAEPNVEHSVSVGSNAINDVTTDVTTEVATDAKTDVSTDINDLKRSSDTELTAAFVTQEDTVAMAESITTRVNTEVERQLAQFHTTMDQRLSQLEVNLWGEKDPVKSKHLQTLLEIGLGAELAVALVNRVGVSHTFEEAMRLSLSDLANTLPVSSDSTLTHDGITFVTGPSGSGKTTTLLKLAAQKMAESGSDSVVMICADANRIGVFESLAAHGKALGVSVVCASTHRELQEMLSFYANKELVLVDQPFQDDVMEFDIPEFHIQKTDVVGVNSRSVRHLLVLPATIQSSVAESVVSKFSNLSSARCVISNLDRPCRVGELFTTLIRNNLRVAYWSDCSDIQKPLNRASAPTLVATAMAMGKRLVPSEDDRYLMDLIHPRFNASIAPMLRGNL